MSESIRERIVASIAALAASITKAHGYSINVHTVARRRLKFGFEQLPAAAIWDNDETSAKFHSGTRQTMMMAIELHADPGSSEPSTVANRLLADARRLMEINRPALVGSVTYDGGGPTTPDEGGQYVAARANFSVVYDTARGNPTAQPVQLTPPEPPTP